MTCKAPVGSSTSCRARRPQSGSARWCSTPVQMTCSKVSPSSAARSTASWRTSRLSSRVFTLQLLRELDALRADVDSDYAGARPTQRVVSGLHRAAAGDQYAAVVAVRLVRPEEMRFGAPAPIVPGAAIDVQIVRGRRIGVVFVKVGYPRGDGRRAFHTELIQLGTERLSQPPLNGALSRAAFLFAPSRSLD